MNRNQKIRTRFVNRFSYGALLDVQYNRGLDWRTETPSEYERNNMAVGFKPASRSARRFWRALHIASSV